MELRLTLPAGQRGLVETLLTYWKAIVQSQQETGGQYSVVSETYTAPATHVSSHQICTFGYLSLLACQVGLLHERDESRENIRKKGSVWMTCFGLCQFASLPVCEFLRIRNVEFSAQTEHIEGVRVIFIDLLYAGPYLMSRCRLRQYGFRQLRRSHFVYVCCVKLNGMRKKNRPSQGSVIFLSK